MLARYMLLSSVCPSQGCVLSTVTAIPRIMQTMPYDSIGTLVWWCQRSRQNSNRVTPTLALLVSERLNCRYWNQMVGIVRNGVADCWTKPHQMHISQICWASSCRTVQPKQYSLEFLAEGEQGRHVPEARLLPDHATHDVSQNLVNCCTVRWHALAAHQCR